jgi:hypothetical protein
MDRGTIGGPLAGSVLPLSLPLPLPLPLLLLLLACGLAAPAWAASEDACALLSAGEVNAATGLTVSSGTPGPAIPGIVGKCTWTAQDGTKIVITLRDVRHIQATLEAQERAGGTAVAALGAQAIGLPAPAFAGGGYLIGVLDRQGGFEVSVLGAGGSETRALALARRIEAQR